MKPLLFLLLLSVFLSGIAQEKDRAMILKNNQNLIVQNDSDYNKIMERKKTYLLKYEKIIDSISKTKIVGVFDSLIFKTTDTLDYFPPGYYFTRSRDLIDQYKLNEASFLFYLGTMRYMYYNATNPAFKKSEDGAFFSAIRHQLSDVLFKYLRANIDNYIAILQKSVDWYIKNDFHYYSRNKSEINYIKQSDKTISLIDELKKNKDHYIIQWKEEPEKMKEKSDSIRRHFEHLKMEKRKRD